MGSEWIIGALAFITIGGTAVLAIHHFVFHLKDPENLAAAKAVAKDWESAATAVSAEGVNGRSLRQRLDQAPSVNDRLSARPVGSIALLLDAKWSDIRATMTGGSSTR